MANGYFNYLNIFIMENKKDLWDQLEKLLEIQRVERVNNIWKVSHEEFQKICKKQEEEIFKLLQKK